MGSRPQSREQTSFPAGNTTISSCTSERLGAFGAVQLDHPTSTHSTHSQSMPEYSHISRPSELWNMEPMVATNGRLNPRLSIETRSSGRSTRLQHQGETPLLKQAHVPSASNVSTSSSRRKPANLSDVVTTSGDTNDLARNLSTYINEKIPPGLSISVLVVLSVIAFVLILMGTFNIPFCQVQPMIPIWLIVAGVLFIITATLRIFRMIPPPRSAHRTSTLSLDLCCRISEGLSFVVNIVWLTLGCIWVYGSKPYVHFEEHMFEEHYCDWTLYWFAFWTCTIYLIIVCILIILLICLMAVVSSKESAGSELEV